jgi:hypothetical protein
MIIDFTVENFKSIKEAQTLSMLASNLKDDHPDHVFSAPEEKNIQLLKSALIYGANASGKSNLILAIRALEFFVLNSTDLKIEDEIPVYEPYKLDTNYQNWPTKFEIEFIGNDQIRYKYTVAFDLKEVIFEELLFYPNRQEALLYRREKGKEIKFGSQLRGRKKNIADELLDNNLFLSKAANSNQDQLKDLYLYFKKNLKFSKADESYISLLPFPFSRTTLMLKEGKDPELKSKIENFLMTADTGIQSIKIEIDENIDEKQFEFSKDFPERIKKEFIAAYSHKPITLHKTYEGEEERGITPFDLKDESSGTIKMYDLSGKIIEILENGYTFVIDELDNSLHPLLAEYILKLFHDPRTNPHHAQIIAATHDVTLLNPRLLRRDQIWFTEKNKLGATQLFSLDEFDKNEVRKNTPYDRWYLDGRFGALPLIASDLFRIKSNKDEG